VAKIFLGFLSLLLFFQSPAFAGDAVVIGYNADGIWTAVTYYCSATPKGGRDYKIKLQAREAARRDLRRRAPEQMVRSSVLAESDLTGYVAVARGQTESGIDVTDVGYGHSQKEADDKALAQLNKAGATAKQKIVYRYFSYGADSGPKSLATDVHR
jgi:hypothetical protein